MGGHSEKKNANKSLIKYPWSTQPEMKWSAQDQSETLKSYLTCIRSQTCIYSGNSGQY